MSLNAKQYYLDQDDSHFEEIKDEVEDEDLSGWEEFYWAGLYLAKYAPDGSYFDLITETIEDSFFEGLSYLSNADCYLEAVRALGRLYLELQQYDLALNMFQMLILKDPNVPDWVHLRYAYAQIHSKTSKRLVDEPKYLFERLERIDTTDQALTGQRSAIFQDYLDLCTEFYLKDGVRLDVEGLFEKTVEYGALHTDAWKRFAVNFPDKFSLTVVDENPEPETTAGEEIEEPVIVGEHLPKECRDRIFAFFVEVREKYPDRLTDSKLIQGLASDMLNAHAKEKNIIKIAVQEGAVSAIIKAVDDTELNQKIAFSNACKILMNNSGFGEAVSVDVINEISRALLFPAMLDNPDEPEEEKEFKSFTDSLVTDLEQQNDQLMDKIHELEKQMGELLKKNQDYEQLLDEKKKIIEQLTVNEACIDDIEKGSANGINSGHDLLDGNKKILVIGQPVVSTDKLLGIVKSFGYNKNDFVFWDDYDKIKSYAERMAGGSFSCIIAGPMPHKVGGLGDYTSLIEKMKQPGYPYLEEARSEGGELKITKTSFRKAVEGVTKHLLAIQ